MKNSDTNLDSQIKCSLPSWWFCRCEPCANTGFAINISVWCRRHQNWAGGDRGALAHRSNFPAATLRASHSRFFFFFAPRSGINWNVIPAPSQPRLIQIEFPASRVVMNKTPTRRRPKFNRHAEIKTLPPCNKTNTTRPITLPNNNKSKILIRDHRCAPPGHTGKSVLCTVIDHVHADGYIMGALHPASLQTGLPLSLSLARLLASSAHVHNAAPIALSAGPWHVERPPEI